MTNEKRKMAEVTPARCSTSCSASPARARPVTLEVYSIVIQILVIQILPGDAVVLTLAGDATISMRAGQHGASPPLGRAQVTVRLDPSPNSRARK
jgi:hypothetical protein